MNITNKSERESGSEKEEKATAEVAPFSNDEATEGDSSLQSLVREEQSFARQRLLEELGREPTEKEIDRWLSAQTEGY